MLCGGSNLTCNPHRDAHISSRQGGSIVYAITHHPCDTSGFQPFEDGHFVGRKKARMDHHAAIDLQVRGADMCVRKLDVGHDGPEASRQRACDIANIARAKKRRTCLQRGDFLPPGLAYYAPGIHLPPPEHQITRGHNFWAYVAPDS